MSVMTATWGTARRARLRSPFLVAFAAAALAAGLGRAVTTSYLPLLLDRINDEPGLIGTIMLVNAAAGMVVPLAIGLWSDRRARRGRGRRLPFVVGGSLLTAGGLAAIALGSSSSYLVLAFAAAVVYTGLNALTTAHRALVPELFPLSGRARATSAQELAMLVGGLLGLAAGGLLTELAVWVPFAVAAVLVPVLALPTVLRTREPEQIEAAARTSRPFGYYLRAASRPGVRGFLAAQILWVLAYAALPAFFLLYAEDVLGLEASVASLWLAGFGLATGIAIVAGGRVRNPRLHRPLLLLGIVLMGGGFLAISATTSLLAIGPFLIVGAIGFGLISTLGFPLFSTHIPEGEAGGYTALYFSVRAISSTIALPAAGWIVEATGSYRALFVLGGIAALAALIPLVGVPRPSGRLETAALLVLAVPALGVLVAQTAVRRLDEELFRALNGLGPGPELLWRVLDPHTRNYLLLIGLAVAAAALTSLPRVPQVFVRVLGSALLSWGLLESIYAVYDRDRPEEVLTAAEISLNGHTWARLESFPSGHMAITSALAVSIALAFPRLRTVLFAYIAAVAVTRVLFGAHFPLDTIAGIALGTASALLVATLLDGRLRRRERDEPADESAPTPLEPAHVVAVMPSHDDVPDRALLAETLGHLGRLVLVDDGSDPKVARELDLLAADQGIELVRLPERRGKGSAVRAGIEQAAADDPLLEAVLVIDADGQHPASAIPAFLAAGATSELVIGDRFHDLAAMPRRRRLANRASRRLLALAAGREVRDTQNGMRLLRGRALELLPPPGGYEAETRHLKRALREGIRVGWVPIPALYAGERSSFRAIRDGIRVLWAIVGPTRTSQPVPRPIAAPRALPATMSVQ